MGEGEGKDVNPGLQPTVIPLAQAAHMLRQAAWGGRPVGSGLVEGGPPREEPVVWVRELVTVDEEQLGEPQRAR